MSIFDQTSDSSNSVTVKHQLPNQPNNEEILARLEKLKVLTRTILGEVTLFNATPHTLRCLTDVLCTIDGALVEQPVYGMAVGHVAVRPPANFSEEELDLLAKRLVEAMKPVVQNSISGQTPADLWAG